MIHIASVLHLLLSLPSPLTPPVALPSVPAALQRRESNGEPPRVPGHDPAQGPQLQFPVQGTNQGRGRVMSMELSCSQNLCRAHMQHSTPQHMVLAQHCQFFVHHSCSSGTCAVCQVLYGCAMLHVPGNQSNASSDDMNAMFPACCLSVVLARGCWPLHHLLLT